ncbi:iron-containing alcohol dehydrogenase [Microbacter margulisiae]|uniref:NADP-dependent alcohol dehydrogenase n=1 Tax=Microbacter margulisiae TaxID=1350067 RepID=A0A7W5DRQ4_9PORP|nr:iron-containing alcohol dehydrogenase [Microbacter margulisiae]MBB3187530.1 NADP-dependent alcohol dehydrogenase [Microbacter margulisiae]
MNNFVFKNSTKLIFGKGTISSLAAEIPAGRRIMMTYGGGSIKKNGVYDQVKAALSQFSVIEFGGIEPNPTYETLMQAVALAKEHHIDFFLAVGGGSVIDGTKFIVTAMLYNGDPWEFMLNPSKAQHAMPFASVLTLPATGSEMNNGSVISKKATQEKLAFAIAETYPQFSILDPEVTFSLPKRQLANGVVDAYVHVMEQYLTYPSESMIQDRFAEGILSTLIEIGEKVVNDEPDYDLRANFMLSATMALNGFISMGVPQDWATHMIGHELTALFGLDHGVTLAIIEPSLLRATKEYKKTKLLQYADRVWSIKHGTEEERIEAAIDKTEAFYRNLGIKTKLHEYNIDNKSFDTIVDRFAKRGWKLGEKQLITPDVIREILNGCL